MLRTSQADFKKMSTLLYHQPKWLVPVPAYLARGLTDRTTRPQIHDRYPYNSSYSEHCSLYELFIFAIVHRTSESVGGFLNRRTNYDNDRVTKNSFEIVLFGNATSFVVVKLSRGTTCLSEIGLSI